MSSKIKRSMSVHPSPIIVDNGRARIPSYRERYPHLNEPYSEWGGLWGYRISRVTNSVEYRPGFALTKAQVQALIDDDWTISVLSKE